MEPFEVFLLFLLTSILLYFYMSRSKSGRPPPGPRPIPILGNALQVGKTPHLTFMRWAKEYGPIVQFKLGSQNWLLVSNAGLIEELYNHPNATGKENGPIFFQVHKGFGLNFHHGPVTDAHRQFTIETLNALRLNKGSWEDIILHDVDILMKDLKKWECWPQQGERKFFDPLFNTLWSIMSGSKQDWNENRSKSVKLGDKIMASLFQVSSNGLLVFPRLRYILPGKMGWNRWVKQNRKLQAMCENCIAEHLSGGQFKQLRDFTDHYLSKLETTKDPKSPFYGELGRKNLVAIMADIFYPGQITATVLAWALVYLSEHQTAQTKLQKEIDASIPGQTKLTIEHRKSMKYTEAILFETLRLASASSIGNPHRLLEDMEFHGYFLKKDTMLAPNFFGIHHDPNIWGDPMVFRPERFVEKEYKKFFPFSVGKKKCVGETLAMDIMFLYIVTIFKRFSVTPQYIFGKPSLIPEKSGIILDPVPFRVVFSPKFCLETDE